MAGGEWGWTLGCAGSTCDKMVTNRTMLRFRPIAPKPITGDPAFAGMLSENKNTLGSSKRVKRKYVRIRKNNGYRRKKGTGSEEAKEEVDKRIVTLQLFPEKSDLKESLKSGSSCDLDCSVVSGTVEEIRNIPMFHNFENLRASFGMPDLMISMEMQQSKRVIVESWVTVECLTDACMGGGEWLGSTDMEKMKNLERDTCPGFISDGINRIQFINEAYRKMAREIVGDDGQSPEIIALLSIKEKLPYMEAAFTCKVKVKYTWGKDWYSQMVPCDVWKMDCGGFAWRLDVKAALSLGR